MLWPRIINKIWKGDLSSPIKFLLPAFNVESTYCSSVLINIWTISISYWITGDKGHKSFIWEENKKKYFCRLKLMLIMFVIILFLMKCTVCYSPIVLQFIRFIRKMIKFVKINICVNNSNLMMQNNKQISHHVGDVKGQNYNSYKSFLIT